MNTESSGVRRIRMAGCLATDGGQDARTLPAGCRSWILDACASGRVEASSDQAGNRPFGKPRTDSLSVRPKPGEAARDESRAARSSRTIPVAATGRPAIQARRASEWIPMPTLQTDPLACAASLYLTPLLPLYLFAFRRSGQLPAPPRLCPNYSTKPFA